MADKVMSGAVREAILDKYLKPTDHADVHVLAASKIALDLFIDAWKELERFAPKEESDRKSTGQVAL